MGREQLQNMCNQDKTFCICESRSELAPPSLLVSSPPSLLPFLPLASHPSEARACKCFQGLSMLNVTVDGPPVTPPPAQDNQPTATPPSSPSRPASPGHQPTGQPACLSPRRMPHGAGQRANVQQTQHGFYPREGRYLVSYTYECLLTLIMYILNFIIIN